MASARRGLGVGMEDINKKNRNINFQVGLEGAEGMFVCIKEALSPPCGVLRQQACQVPLGNGAPAAVQHACTLASIADPRCHLVTAPPPGAECPEQCLEQGAGGAWWCYQG